MSVAEYATVRTFDRLAVVDGYSRCGHTFTSLGVMEPIDLTATFEDGRQEVLRFCDEECRQTFELGWQAVRAVPIEDLIDSLAVARP